MRSASLLFASCLACDGGLAAAPQDRGPQLALKTVVLDDLCVTSGRLSAGRAEAPTFRAVALGHAGNAAAIKLLVHGETRDQRLLDSGKLRRQVGLKLRAQDSCNLVYVMWRLDPKPSVEVSIKRNAGARTSKECGARGYSRVKPKLRSSPPALADRRAHELHAEITGDALTAWTDGSVVWQGTLPATASALSGPAGARSDNLDFDLIELRVDASAAPNIEIPCRAADSSD